jgi:tetratricopeptide repeat protein 30
MATVIREGTFTKTIYGFIRDQKYEDSIQVLTYQLQLFPRSRAALSLLAYSYYFSGDFPNAVQTYEMLVKFYPNVTRYKIYYAQSLLKAGLYEEATKNSLRVKEEEHEQRMLKLRAHVKYEQDDIPGCRAIIDQCIQDDPDTIISYACIEFKNGNFDGARKLFVDAIGALGYQPDLAYNVALCYYKLTQYGSALKHLGEIVEKGVRFHPELSIGSNNEMTAARSVGNSQLLKETALIEAFNLKAAIECVSRSSRRRRRPPHSCLFVVACRCYSLWVFRVS